jgi:tubulin monoglycylase TTLL3/8
MLVSDQLERVLGHVDENFVAGQRSCWVVQRYIHRPLLLLGRKFDIRCWVAIDRQLRVHAWRQLSGRIASEPYRLVDLENTFVHLTNPFVQKRHPEFGNVAHGNELLFDELAAQLGSLDRSIDLDRDIVAPMHAIISQTIAAVRREPPADYDGMQILGYDFMFDADLRCHLLEVNFSPSAGRSLERLVADFIEVTIDPLFPPVRPQPGRTDNAFVRIDV